MTREPEMVKAYRDTWELGLHSYLTYLRDRLYLAKYLLTRSGSVFVQISDENLHHVREIMDEVFGAENFVSVIQFKKTAYQETDLLANVCDFIVWYAKDIKSAKVNRLYKPRDNEMIESGFTWIELSNGQIEKAPAMLSEDPPDSKRFQSSNLTSQGYSQEGSQPYEYNNKTYDIGGNRHWKTHRLGLNKLAQVGRLFGVGNTLSYKRYEKDFPYAPFNNMWEDTVRSTFAASKIYVVQT
jgi:adenine-specific DNA-methyltransferase